MNILTSGSDTSVEITSCRLREKKSDKEREKTAKICRNMLMSSTQLQNTPWKERERLQNEPDLKAFEQSVQNYRF